MNSIKTIISMIESKAIDDGLKFRNQINAEAQCKVGSEVMREKEYSEWLSKQGFDALLHANCCKIAFNGGWESRQTEVDELTLQVAEMKSRLNDAYTDGQSAMYAARQSKVDELQKRVDAALKILSSKKKMYVDMFIEIEQALKGEHA